jgi:hypothetical protein
MQMQVRSQLKVIFMSEKQSKELVGQNRIVLLSDGFNYRDSQQRTG